MLAHGMLMAAAKSLDYRSLILQDAPVGYWRLGEESGTTASDSSGHGLDAAIVGSVGLGASGLVAGNPGMSFTPGGGYIRIGSKSALSLATYTIEAWVKISSLSAINRIFSNYIEPEANPYNGVVLYIGTDGKINLWNSNATYNGSTENKISSGSIVNNVIYRIAASRAANGDVAFYINGTSAGSASGAETPAFGSTIAKIGAIQSSANFSGVIDEVAVYDYVLSPQQHAAHYAAGTS